MHDGGPGYDLGLDLGESDMAEDEVQEPLREMAISVNVLLDKSKIGR